MSEVHVSLDDVIERRPSLLENGFDILEDLDRLLLD
jgi:hypothetical protein